MISVTSLTKTYGTRRAVDNLSFTVEPGRVTGFVGPNGSGKSTTMRMMVGLTRPPESTRYSTRSGSPQSQTNELAASPLACVSASLWPEPCSTGADYL